MILDPSRFNYIDLNPVWWVPHPVSQCMSILGAQPTCSPSAVCLHLVELCKALCSQKNARARGCWKLFLEIGWNELKWVELNWHETLERQMFATSSSMRAEDLTAWSLYLRDGRWARAFLSAYLQILFKPCKGCRTWKVAAGWSIWGFYGN